MREKIKIAFAHHNINSNTQGILAGITEYIHSNKKWQLIVWPDSTPQTVEFLRQRGCKGAFVSAETSSKAEELLKIDIPMVGLSTMQEVLNLPYISAEANQITKMAGGYFLNKKFENFAFFGVTQAKWSLERMEYFVRHLEKEGREVQVFKGTQIPVTSSFVSFTKLWMSSTLKTGQDELVQWLKRLRKPTAVLASCDILGCHLINVAKEIGLSIPKEIAVMGIQNDLAICNIVEPPLSSVALNFKKAGYEAAEFMDKLISGKEKMAGQCIRIQPTHIESRGSTDAFAVEDKEIVQALKYIKRNITEPLQVDEIAKAVCISKRALQLRFQKVLGRSVHDEIVQVRFENAKMMMAGKKLTIDEIAIRSGFASTINMRRAFKKITGLLPQEYRQLHRLS